MKRIFTIGLVLVLAMGMGLAFAEAAESKPDSPPGLDRRPPLEKRVFIHYRKGYGKPPWAGGGKKPKNGVKCYGFLAKGAKWKALPTDYYVNPTNSQGLKEKFVDLAVASASAEWDRHTNQPLFANAYLDYDATWDDELDEIDGRNELVFGDYPQSGVIAVAVAWGYFSGPPSYREIIEFDVLFDEDYQWGNAEMDESVMDLQNIATHEIGHGLGLDDVYDDACSAVTMFGRSTEGEIEKRSLEPADIIGLQGLYGE